MPWNGSPSFNLEAVVHGLKLNIVLVKMKMLQLIITIKIFQQLCFRYHTQEIIAINY